MEINNIIEIIAESGNRGKELMIDSFILGIAWGRKIITTIPGIQSATKYIYELNQEVELSQKSPFNRLDLFHKFMLEENCPLFPQVETNFKQLPKSEIRQEPEKNDKKQVVFNKVGSNQSLCGICKFYINDLDEEKYQVPQCAHEFHNLCLYQEIDQKGLQKCYTCQIWLDPSTKTQIFKKISTSFKSSCPNSDCQGEFIYFGQQKFHCQVCNMVCCLKCKSVEHTDVCKFEIDSIDMKQGQKFKFCSICFQTIELNFQDISTHKCSVQEEKPNSRFQGFYNPFKKVGWGKK